METIGVVFSVGPVVSGFRLRTDKQIETFEDEPIAMLVSKQNVYRASAVKNPFTAFRHTAQAKGLVFTQFGARPVNMFTLRRGRTVELFTTGMSSRVTTSLRVLLNDKELTKAWLAAHGLPVAQGGVAADVDEGIAWWHDLGEDAVVKPIIGHKGRGVSVGLRNETDFRTAFAAAQRYHPRVLVEETVHGLDLRVVVIDGHARAAVMRVPASVVGDGKTTVVELVKRKNRGRQRNPHLALRPLRIDENALRVLGGQGLGPEAVPAVGRRVFLTYTANLAAGGDSVSVLERLHPAIVALTEAAASSFGQALYLGVDVLLERLDVPPSQQRCAICEINSNASPNVSLFPAYGAPFDTAAAVVDQVLQNTAPDAHPHEATFEVEGPEHVSSFGRWLSGRAGTKAVVRVANEGRCLHVSMKGSARPVEALADQMWRWPGLGGACVDRVRRVSAPYTPASNEIVRLARPKAALAGDPSRFERATRPHPRADDDCDVALLCAAFERHGVRAAPRDDGWYLLEHNGRHGLFGSVQSGLPLTRLARLRFPLLRWLADAGWPVPRHTVFALEDLDAARTYLRWRGTPQRLRWVWEGPTWWRSVSSDEELVDAWGGWPELVNIEGGLEERRRLRDAMWEVWHEQMRGEHIDEDDFLARAWGMWPLRVRALQLEEEVLGPCASVAVIDGRPMLLGGVAQADALGERTVAWCEGTAAAVASSLPNADFVVVELRLDNPVAPGGDPSWTIVDVDSTPRLDRIERRCAGDGAAVADRVVRELALSDRTFWYAAT